MLVRSASEGVGVVGVISNVGSLGQHLHVGDEAQAPFQGAGVGDRVCVQPFGAGGVGAAGDIPRSGSHTSGDGRTRPRTA